MSNMFLEKDIFPSWATKFGHLRDISDRIECIRTLRERRAKGNQELPYLDFNSQFWEVFRFYAGMHKAEEGRTDLPVDKAYPAHKLAIETFTPVAHRSFLARWLYLERAFEVTSRSGNLLFGAIVLRTMAEDVWAALELSRFEAELDLGSKAPTIEDLSRIRRHGDLLWERFLPPIKELQELPGRTHLKSFEGPDYDSLKNTFHSLNDYVHPNYGSHLLALFPERVRALEVLLDAYIVIYDAFFEIPWIESPPEGPRVKMPPIVLRSWKDEVAFLQSNLLPEIQRHRAERGLAGEDKDPAPNFKRWITEDENPAILWEAVPGWFEPLRPLAHFVLQDSTISDTDLCQELMAQSGLGLPKRLRDLFLLSGARQSALEFERRFPKGRPMPEEDPLNWFAFCEKAIELLLTITQHKMSLMIEATIRQLNDHNPVGSLLAMRSVIEHYMVTVFLGKRLVKSWEKIAKQGSSGVLPTGELLRLEEDIARFLAGTKGTIEEATPWKAQWTQLGLDRAINLRAAAESGLEQDVLGYLYNFASDVIHGRKARGIELCPPTDAVYVRANLSRALLGIELIMDIDAIVNLIRDAHQVIGNIKSLRKALSRPDVSEKRVVQTALTAAIGYLKHGVHYAGKGTIDDPFKFAEGVEYYSAFYKLCEQLGLDTSRRMLIQKSDGTFLDRVPDSDGKYHYFAPPILKEERKDG